MNRVGEDTMASQEFQTDMTEIMSYQINANGNLTAELVDNRVIRIYVTRLSKDSDLFCFCSRVNSESPVLLGRGTYQQMIDMRDRFIDSLNLEPLSEPIEDKASASNPHQEAASHDHEQGLNNQHIVDNLRGRTGIAHNYLKHRTAPHDVSPPGTDIVVTPEVLRIRFNIMHPVRREPIFSKKILYSAGLGVGLGVLCLIVLLSGFGTHMFADNSQSHVKQIAMTLPAHVKADPVTAEPAMKTKNMSPLATPAPVALAELNQRQIAKAGYGPWGFKNVPVKAMWKGDNAIPMPMPGGGNAILPQDFAVLGLNL